MQQLIDQAEEIRQVANDMEGALRRHKEAVIEAGRAYLRLRGGRGWDDGSGAPADGAAAGGPAARTASLPPPGGPSRRGSRRPGCPPPPTAR